jgi:hypothetical protein
MYSCSGVCFVVGVVALLDSDDGYDHDSDDIFGRI